MSEEINKMPYINGFQKSNTNPKGIDLLDWKYVFKFDINDHGGKETLGVDNFQIFLEEVYCNSPKNFYQVIREDHIVREYYDIDMEGKFHQEEWETLTIDFVRNFLYHRNNLDTTKNLLKEDFIILTAHKPEKLSFHLYSKKTAFKCIYHHKEFASQLKESIPEIDLSVYSKNRAMRLIGNSKYGQNRPLTSWSGGNIKILDTWIELPKKKFL